MHQKSTLLDLTSAALYVFHLLNPPPPVTTPAHKALVLPVTIPHKEHSISHRILTRPGLCKQMADGLKGAGPLTPLVGPLGVVAASFARRLQLAAIHLHCGGLGQNCLNVSVCHWVLLLLGGIKHLHFSNSEVGVQTAFFGAGKMPLLEMASDPCLESQATLLEIARHPYWNWYAPLLRFVSRLYWQANPSRV